VNQQIVHRDAYAVSEEGSTLELQLTDLAHLFNAPRINPMSQSPVEVLGINGFDYLLTRVHANKSAQRARTLVLILPVGKADPELSSQTTFGIHRMAELRIEQLQRELSSTYRAGWKVGGLALIVLAICLALSSLFASEVTQWMRPLLRKTFEYGFEIIGWVVLWHPIDVLGFTPLYVRSRIRDLRALRGISVVIRGAEPPEL
jgi:hypothetical protein